MGETRFVRVGYYRADAAPATENPVIIAVGTILLFIVVVVVVIVAVLATFLVGRNCAIRFGRNWHVLKPRL